MNNLPLWIPALIAAVAFLVLAGWLLSGNKKRPKRAKSKQTLPEKPRTVLPPTQHSSALPSGDFAHLQLEIIRQSLQLTSAILLWSNRDEPEIRVLSASSLRDDIVQHPFSRGSGFIGGLKDDCAEISVCPVPRNLVIPYFSSRRQVGALLGLAIPLSSSSGSAGQPGLAPMAILCLDREDEEPWTDAERNLASLCCSKISQDLHLFHKIEEISRNKQVIHQICLGMQDLNQVLELQAVFTATIKMVKEVSSADFIAVSLKENDLHRIVKAGGTKADRFEGLEFPVDDGLVGQAIKLRRWMPSHDNYQEEFPVFSNEMRMVGLKSLLVLPLLNGDNQAIGALTVAGKKTGMFPADRREILQVIVSQVTTKIELARAHEKIFHLATTDGLTELSNHRTFQNACDNMLNRAQRQSTPLTLVLCDLDHFKIINDTFGHPTGDLVLQQVARVLASSVRKVDLAARYGGEEFALLLEDSNHNGARIQVERVRQAISDLALIHEGRRISVTMSFGLAAYPVDADNKNDLIHHADQALYRAKAGGRNRTVCWSDLQSSR
ncbi:MAG: GGDEF domain-containing protein [Pseudomonadota bacterium]